MPEYGGMGDEKLIVFKGILNVWPTQLGTLVFLTGKYFWYYLPSLDLKSPTSWEKGNGLLMMMMRWWPTLESSICAVISMREVERSGCSTTHCSNTSCACFVFPCLPNNAASTTFASKDKWGKSCFNASKSLWHTSSWWDTNLLVNWLKCPLSYIYYFFHSIR